MLKWAFKVSKILHVKAILQCGVPAGASGAKEREAVLVLTCSCLTRHHVAAYCTERHNSYITATLNG
jgi:hypothetical protein